MQRAKALLQQSTSRTTGILSLSSAIKQHLCLGQPRTALAHFLKWRERRLEPDKFTVPSLLKLSMALDEPPLHGEQIHCFVVKSGYVQDLFIRTTLVEMYFKNGHVGSCARLFGENPTRDVALSTAMISGFARNGFGGDALGFFFDMLKQGVEPNRWTIASVFAVCSQLKDVMLGKVLHCLSLRRGLLVMADVVLQTSLLDMYGKCGNLRYSKRVFDRTGERNSVSCHCIIDAHYANGLFQSALGLFREMVMDGYCRPRSSMLALVLSICGMTSDLRKGKEVHGYILRCNRFSNEVDNLVECNAVINMYVKVGDINSAILLFKSMSEKDVITWTVMISGYGTHGMSRKALDAFGEMNMSGIRPDGVTFLSILSACSHGGLVQEGRELFLSMQRDYKNAPEMKHFVCMVDLYGRVGLLKEAFDFIRSMPVEPSKCVWGSLLSSCRNHKNLKLGEFAARKALQSDPYDASYYVLLSRLYADAQCWEGVAKVRLLMKELGLKADTAYSWLEIKGKVYQFSVGDQLKAFSRKMFDFLKKAGFKSDTSVVGHNLDDEEEKVSDLCGHTEKVALAFAVMRGLGGENLIRIGSHFASSGGRIALLQRCSMLFDISCGNEARHPIEGQASKSIPFETEASEGETNYIPDGVQSDNKTKGNMVPERLEKTAKETETTFMAGDTSTDGMVGEPNSSPIDKGDEGGLKTPPTKPSDRHQSGRRGRSKPIKRTYSVEAGVEGAQYTIETISEDGEQENEGAEPLEHLVDIDEKKQGNLIHGDQMTTGANQQQQFGFVRDDVLEPEKYKVLGNVSVRRRYKKHRTSPTTPCTGEKRYNFRPSTIQRSQPRT